eukprot:430392-Pleurochrysis_carterae.AAC.1
MYSATPPLGLARTWARRRLSGLRIAYRRRAHTPLIKQASEAQQPLFDVLRAHVARVRLGGPELLGDGGEARPDRLFEVARVDGLAPHLAVPAEHEAAQRTRHARARVVRIYAAPVDVQVVQVPAAEHVKIDRVFMEKRLCASTHAWICAFAAMSTREGLHVAGASRESFTTKLESQTNRPLGPCAQGARENVPRGVVVPNVAQHVVAELEHLRHVGGAPPHVDDGLLGQRAFEVVEDLGPLHRPPALRNGRRGDALDEVGIPVVGRHVARLEPARDGGHLLPALRVHLVAAEVEKLVGEEARRSAARLRQRQYSDVSCSLS